MRCRLHAGRRGCRRRSAGDGPSRRPAVAADAGASTRMSHAEVAARRRRGPATRSRSETRGITSRRPPEPDLAVARADGLRQGRLVQLRPARPARRERRRDRRGVECDQGRRHHADAARAAGSRSSSSSRIGRSVLRSDTAPRAGAGRGLGEAHRERNGRRVDAAGLAASGALLSQTPQQFSASWAFVLEPLEGGRSRLVERFRVRYGESGVASHVVMPAVGFGVFVMMQRQMTGIRARAERPARTRVAPPANQAPRLPPSHGLPRSRSRRRSRRRGAGRTGARVRDRGLIRPIGSAPATSGRRRAVGRPDAVGFSGS